MLLTSPRLPIRFTLVPRYETRLLRLRAPSPASGRRDAHPRLRSLSRPALMCEPDSSPSGRSREAIADQELDGAIEPDMGYGSRPASLLLAEEGRTKAHEVQIERARHVERRPRILR